MSKYIYRDIEDAKPGDIVEFDKPGYIGAFTDGKPYIVANPAINLWGDLAVTRDDKGSTTNGMNKSNFKLLKTAPGDTAKAGDTCMCIANPASASTEVGKVYTIADCKVVRDKSYIYWDVLKGRHRRASEFLVLCTPDPLDLSYWDNQYESNVTVWLVTCDSEIDYCLGMSPSNRTDPKGFYASEDEAIAARKLFRKPEQTNMHSSATNIAHTSDNAEQKEYTMKKNNILLEINADCIKQITEQEKVVKTDLQMSKERPFTGVIYAEDGSKFETISAKTEKKLNTIFAGSAYRDMTMEVSKVTGYRSETRNFKTSKK